MIIEHQKEFSIAAARAGGPEQAAKREQSQSGLVVCSWFCPTRDSPANKVLIIISNLSRPFFPESDDNDSFKAL